jgi:ribosomal protein S27AE
MTNLPAPSVKPLTAPVPADELCIAIDADCPNCGWPERVAPLADYDTGRPQRFACRKCTYVSLEREA